MKKLQKKVSKTNNEDEITSPQIVVSIDDLLIGVFLRLPLKPLIRFKLVCKHWNFIISSPRFYVLLNHQPNPAAGLIFQSQINIHNPDANKFFNKNPHRSHLLVRPSYPYVVSLDHESTSPSMRMLNFTNPWSWGARVLSSCNGLLVCVTSDSSGSNNLRYHVCNPTTNKYFTLPDMERRVGGWKTVFLMVLAYDPAKSPHYKVVFPRRCGGITQCTIEVYSSETGRLEKCEEPYTFELGYENGVYWNGAVHWVANSICFNLDTEMLQVMPKPPTAIFSDSSRNFYFGESCGHLHFIDHCSTRRTEFDVYEMRRDYSEWFVKYSVNLSHIFSDLFYNRCTLVRGKEDSDDSFLVLSYKEKFISYNLVDKTWETICDLEGDRFDDLFSDFSARSPFQYIESLASP